MKIEGKKDLGACRAEARSAVDAVYVPKLNAAMGPKFALYQVKAMLAQAGYVMSANDDPNDILMRFSSLAKSLAPIEDERQAIQARIDAATTASEIDAIVTAL